MKDRKKPSFATIGIIAVYLMLVGLSFLLDFGPGIKAGNETWKYFLQMAVMFPGAFVLIGLFEVWVDRGMVERHMGAYSGPRGYFWALVLAATITAPLIIALPVANSLRRKGAGLHTVIAFVGASTICRIPMTVFEAGYLGIPFSLVRFAVSLPLVIVSAEIIGQLLKKREYRLPECE